MFQGLFGAVSGSKPGSITGTGLGQLLGNTATYELHVAQTFAICGLEGLSTQLLKEVYAPKAFKARFGRS